MGNVSEVFAECFHLLIGNEGGYSNNPKDPGGETMWGVTKTVARAYGYSGEMRNLPLQIAQSIAKEKYWDPYQCDSLPKGIAFQVFDTAYNGGKPVQWLQMALGEVVDGKMGSKTVNAAHAANPWKVIAFFNSYRLEYLANLKQPTFANGRMNRIAKNLREGE